MGLLDMGVKMGLDKVRESVVNPRLEGIGKVEEMTFRDKKLYARLQLEDLEDHPLEITCEDISVAGDGSSVTVGKFTANKKFMRTALDRYLAGRPIPIPEGKARLAILAAKKLMGL